jgi:molybdenum cofactor biosynthesis enzyme
MSEINTPEVLARLRAQHRAEMAQAHIDRAEELLATIKTEKRMGRGIDLKDAHIASVAAAHATLALVYGGQP